MSRISSLMTALALTVVGPAFSVAPAYAVMMPAPPEAILDAPLVEVQDRAGNGRSFNRGGRGYHGSRYHRRYRYGGYGHRRHYGYGSGFGFYGGFPFGFGSFLGGYGLGGYGFPGYAFGGYGYGGYGHNDYGYYGDDWRVACSHKYRSFDWDTGLYFGYDGHYHRCRL